MALFLPSIFPALWSGLREGHIAPRFDHEEFEKARREMISDLELMVDEDGHLARHCLGQLIHHGSTLGQPALGSLQSLRNVSLDAVKQRHQETYVQSRLWTSSGGI